MHFLKVLPKEFFYKLYDLTLEEVIDLFKRGYGVLEDEWYINFNEAQLSKYRKQRITYFLEPG